MPTDNDTVKIPVLELYILDSFAESLQFPSCEPSLFLSVKFIFAGSAIKLLGVAFL